MTSSDTTGEGAAARGTVACDLLPWPDPWPRGPALRAALIARCDAYGAATGTPRSQLSLAVARNADCIQRLSDGGDIGLDLYDDICTGLERVEALAGMAPDKRPWPSGADLRGILLTRSAAYCEATGLMPTRLAKVIGKTAAQITRIASEADLRLSNYDACMSALDARIARLDAFIAHEREGRHDSGRGRRGEDDIDRLAG